VYGPSEVIDSLFHWEDEGWCGIPLRNYIIYELHVGTYTENGSFDAVIPHLDTLRDLGITAVELMPVAEFPGERNWGYDGVYPFAVQSSYGGPAGLKRLVNACHTKGLAVVLDVVYNHLGPEGNYLRDYGPYFTDRYKTPWGSAVNFDGPYSDEVRRYFLENALYWIRDFHVDALRIDAVHAMMDFSARPFLEELALAVQEEAALLGRRIYLMPESALNDTRLICSRELGGFGLDAQWNDDFHHALHTLLTGEKTGYYRDFGCLRHLAKAYQEGYVYTGEPSAYRRRRHGRPSREIPAERFIVFSQNHDQVGNRIKGERLVNLVPFEALKLAAGVVLLSPFIPLLFMGEEYGEEAPFPYFISHSDPELIRAVREGRREEFASFGWQEDPPDPNAEETFLAAKLNHKLRQKGKHEVLLNLYKELIRLRKKLPALRRLSKEGMEVACMEKENVLLIRRRYEQGQGIAVFHFGEERAVTVLPFPTGNWIKRLDSTEERW
jgi:maltooligosyltrehalose trehalohydrolase